MVRSRREELFELELAGTDDVARLIERAGATPLPPYIRRDADEEDAERYQTVYARRPGAVAAPTAGLHFDRTLLAALEDRGIEIARVTLHVGAGTFAPLRGRTVESHTLHREWLEVSAATCAAIERTRSRGGAGDRHRHHHAAGAGERRGRRDAAADARRDGAVRLPGV